MTCVQDMYSGCVQEDDCHLFSLNLFAIVRQPKLGNPAMISLLVYTHEVGARRVERERVGQVREL